MPEKKPSQPIPDGYTSVTPWIIVKGAAALIDFLKTAFDAQEAENSRVVNEDGTIGHAELRIGTGVVMLFDAKDDWLSTPGFFRLYVEDGQATFDRAIKAGATPITTMTPLMFGDTVGRVSDPAGNIWWIQQRLEDIDMDEMQRRGSEQQYIDAMQYVQNSLIEEFRRRSDKTRSSTG